MHKYCTIMNLAKVSLRVSNQITGQQKNRLSYSLLVMHSSLAVVTRHFALPRFFWETEARASASATASDSIQQPLRRHFCTTEHRKLAYIHSGHASLSTLGFSAFWATPRSLSRSTITIGTTAEGPDYSHVLNSHAFRNHVQRGRRSLDQAQRTTGINGGTSFHSLFLSHCASEPHSFPQLAHFLIM